MAEAEENLERQTIRALKKNPDEPPSSVLRREVEALHGAGQRAERKQLLLSSALKYLFGHSAGSAEQQNRILASRAGFARRAAQYLAGRWEDACRPRTWVEALTHEQRIEWARVKCEYLAAVHASQEEAHAAKAEYKRLLREEQRTQEAARQQLRSWLLEHGVPLDVVEEKLPPLEEPLGAELQALDVTGPMEVLALVPDEGVLVANGEVGWVLEVAERP